MKLTDTYTELLGIIGGVGPEASNYFVSLLIKLRRKDAKTDQDHIPFLLFNNPQIPDRTSYLLYSGENPLPELVATGMVLKNAGATFIVIPCNTAHAFVEQVESMVGLEVLNMIRLTAEHIVEKYGTKVTVGILGTDGTMKSKLYEKTFAVVSKDAIVIVPDEAMQKKVMGAIYDIKASSVNNSNFSILHEAAEELVRRGAQIVILGCTEIPLALTKSNCVFPIVDPMEILAQKAIEKVIASRVNNVYTDLPN